MQPPEELLLLGWRRRVGRPLELVHEQRDELPRQRPTRGIVECRVAPQEVGEDRRLLRDRQLQHHHQRLGERRRGYPGWARAHEHVDGSTGLAQQEPAGEAQHQVAVLNAEVEQVANDLATRRLRHESAFLRHTGWKGPPANHLSFSLLHLSSSPNTIYSQTTTQGSQTFCVTHRSPTSLYSAHITHPHPHFLVTKLSHT